MYLSLHNLHLERINPCFTCNFPLIMNRKLECYLTVILPLWGLSSTATMLIMAQKRKLARLVFGRFRIVESLLCRAFERLNVPIFVMLFAKKPSKLGPNGPHNGWDFTFSPALPWLWANMLIEYRPKWWILFVHNHLLYKDSVFLYMLYPTSFQAMDYLFITLQFPEDSHFYHGTVCPTQSTLIKSAFTQ